MNNKEKNTKNNASNDESSEWKEYAEKWCGAKTKKKFFVWNHGSESIKMEFEHNEKM